MAIRRSSTGRKGYDSVSWSMQRPVATSLTGEPPTLLVQTRVTGPNLELDVVVGVCKNGRSVDARHPWPRGYAHLCLHRDSNRFRSSERTGCRRQRGPTLSMRPWCHMGRTIPMSHRRRFYLRRPSTVRGLARKWREMLLSMRGVHGRRDDRATTTYFVSIVVVGDGQSAGSLGGSGSGEQGYQSEEGEGGDHGGSEEQTLTVGIMRYCLY
jgi:hypothetical protein